jgi:fructan beta-fructosidase
MIRCIVILLAPLVSCAAALAFDGPDIVIADFEGDTYGDWQATGDAFGPGPARGTLPGQMTVSGFEGRGLVNTFRGGDAATGTLTSPPFRIERKFVRFLIGGGRDEARLKMDLIVDGKAVRTATGPNDRPGGSEALGIAGWDVGEFRGKPAVIRIEDAATGGWGHINVDQIVLTDTKPPMPIRDPALEIVASERHLHFPIRNGAPKRKVTLFVDGKAIVRNDIELADGTPDWWAPMDISAWKGKRLKIVVDSLPGDSKALAAIDQRSMMVDQASLYREPLRGQLHFSPKRGWNNDPNGLVWFNGEYHMFFQHNPYGWGWGNMHWGHAVSRDLVHWQERGDVLWPDAFGPMFSGSAVVDHRNASGLGTKDKPPMVLLYTAAGDPTVQCLAFSTDGRTFTKYDRNPVLGQVTGGNRDPKVIFHEPSGQWVMVLYVEKPKGLHTTHFYVSKNLIDWTLASIFDGDKAPGRYLYECPDFFPLNVDGDPNRQKWVLMAADGQYAIGTFDGTKFTAEHERLSSHLGRGFYAAQTFSDIPASDGRRIRVGWWQTETRGMPFNQSMTLPHELKLVSTLEGPRLASSPIEELKSLRAKPRERLIEPKISRRTDQGILGWFDAEMAEIRIEFASGNAVANLNVRGAEIVIDGKVGEMKVNGHHVKLPKRKGLDLIVYVDRTGLEIFAADGLVYVPFPFQPKPENREYSLKVDGGFAALDSLESFELDSIWTPKP